jgi:hypothetical protein
MKMKNIRQKHDQFIKSLSLLLLLVLILPIFITACQPNQTTLTIPEDLPEDFPSVFPTPLPEVLDACLAKGGRWDVLGINGPGCNLPTTDGGKICQEREDCQSACLGDPKLVMRKDEYGNLVPDHEGIEQLNAKKKVKFGLCSAWQENFGCNVWLQQGRFVVMCVD